MSIFGSLERAYVDGLTVDWDNARGGFSTVALADDEGRPVAVFLGEYTPGEIDARMDAAVNLFQAAPDLLEAAKEFVRKVEAGEARSTKSYAAFKAAIAKAQGAEA